MVNTLLLFVIIMLCYTAECHSVVYYSTRYHSAECHFNEYHYADCHSTEVHSTKFNSAECHSDECHGALYRPPFFDLDERPGIRSSLKAPPKNCGYSRRQFPLVAELS